MAKQATINIKTAAAIPKIVKIHCVCVNGIFHNLFISHDHSGAGRGGL